LSLGAFQVCKHLTETTGFAGNISLKYLSGAHGVSSYSPESLRRSLVKVAAEIPWRGSVWRQQWPESLKACVEAYGGHFE